MHACSLKHLSNDAVAQELAATTSADRRSLAAHLARIAEFDRRALCLDRGCSSMHRYCVDRLRLSEDAAVEHKTSKQVRRLLADRFGAPPWVVRFVPAVAIGEPARVEALPQASPADVPVLKRVLAPLSSPNPVGPPEPLAARPGEAPVSAPLPRQARLTPIAPGLTELVAIIGEEACAQLEASRERLGHVVPSGNLAEVLERAIALQYETLRKRRCADTDRPRTSTSRIPETNTAAAARRIPAALRRAVWRRDGGRCAFLGADGHRCEERGRLELDHVTPVAHGGRATLENLRLLCRAHNQHAAGGTLGREHVSERRPAAERRRSIERHFKQAECERAGKRRADIARQRDELGEAFHLLGYRGPELERALAYCASKSAAPPEERLRDALGCMARQTRKESPAPGRDSAPSDSAA